MKKINSGYRTVKSAPKAGKISRIKIERAVKTVSASHNKIIPERRIKNDEVESYLDCKDKDISIGSVIDDIQRICCMFREVSGIYYSQKASLYPLIMYGQYNGFVRLLKKFNEFKIKIYFIIYKDLDVLVQEYGFVKFDEIWDYCLGLCEEDEIY